MNNKIWYRIWAGYFIVCAIAGFIPEPQGFLRVLFILLSLMFFIPGGVLLYRAQKAKDPGTARVVRSLSLVSLVSTLLFLVLNLISGRAGAAAGDFLYGLLVIFSSPMVCGQYWVMSLFLWACLLTGSLSVLKKLKKK